MAAEKLKTQTELYTLSSDLLYANDAPLGVVEVDPLNTKKLPQLDGGGN